MKSFGSHPSPPSTDTCSQSMRHDFSPSQNGSFRVRQCITLPITRNEDLVTANEHFNFSQRFNIKEFQSLQDLDRLIELGHDRQLWKHQTT